MEQVKVEELFGLKEEDVTIIETKEISRIDVILKNSVDVEVEFFWDSHGNKVPFPGGPKKKKSYSKVRSKVRIVSVVSEMSGIEFTEWELFVNDERISGSVESYSCNKNNNIMRIKVIVGWG